MSGGDLVPSGPSGEAAGPWPGRERSLEPGGEAEGAAGAGGQGSHDLDLEVIPGAAGGGLWARGHGRRCLQLGGLGRSTASRETSPFCKPCLIRINRVPGGAGSAGCSR